MNTPPYARPHRILLCVTGISPAIVTEMLYALITQNPPFIPDEIHVVTTLVGKRKVVNELLAPHHGAFHRLLQEYLPATTIRFDEGTIHVIQQDGEALEDITTDSENKAAANSCYKVMRDLKNAKPNTHIHASVAGGRKSMSFYMGHAFSLLAEPQDILSHVLVTEPFERVKNFYYPPKTPVELDNQGKMVNTKYADIKLAELSVLKLGHILGKELPKKAQEDFDFAVKIAQATFSAPLMKVVFNREKKKGHLEVCGEIIKLSPLEFSAFAVHAIVKSNSNTLIDFSNLGKDLNQFIENQIEKNCDQKEGFTPVYSKINKKLREMVGSVAQHFTIDAVGDRVKGANRPTQLKAPAECLVLEGLDHWWERLKPNLHLP